LTSLLVGCARQLEVSVEFEDAWGLSTGAPVYLERQVIGEVGAVRQQAGSYVVSLSLDPAKSVGLRRGSAALIMERDGVTAIVLHNSLRGKEPLAERARLRGLNSPLEYSAWQTTEAVDYASESLQQVFATVSAYLESERWRQQQREMREHLARMDQATQDAVASIEGDIEALAGELNQAAGATNRSLIERYEELSRRLAQQMTEMAKHGQEDVIAPLQEFLQALEPAMEQEQKQQ
jgi:hypothetical protein